MKNLSKFKSSALSTAAQRAITGGDACSNCVHSAFIACNASCGGGACSVSECVNNQTSQCLGQSYCQ